MRRMFLAALFFFCATGFGAAYAGPGDYSLRVHAGPSFELNDWDTQGRLGVEFDYDFGYQLGFNLISSFGISDVFRFDLVPSVRYDYLYIGPAAMYGLFGMGLGVYEDNAAFDMRFGTGIMFPLGDRFDFSTNVNLFLAPAGAPGTPLTLDWILAFGGRFR